MPTTYAVPDGRTAMAATLWTGTQAARTIDNSVNGVSFQPDLIWTKSRSDAESHRLSDSVRGGNGTVLYTLLSNDLAAQGADTDATGFVSNGFTIRAGTNSPNVTGRTYVGWQWKAGGSTVTNTAGSITSSVNANPTTGFSIVRWTGTGASGTTGHGLGVAPKFMILKDASNNYNWYVYTTATGSNLRFEGLNTTSAASSQPSQFTTTSTLIENIPGVASLNTSGATMILYCWAQIAGFSAFGSYTGNGSSDGPFVYLGFRPRYVMIKRTDATADWFVFDTARNTFNTMSSFLRPNWSDAEATNTNHSIDFLSNGFKSRAVDTGVNASGGTFIYAAFAENPFAYANAR